MAEVNQSYQSLSHSQEDCKYHGVFIPKKYGKFCFSKLDGSWGRFSRRWLGRNKARFWKVL